MPAVKHNSGGLMIWPCLAATVVGHFAVIDLTMNSFLYKSTLEVNVR